MRVLVPLVLLCSTAGAQELPPLRPGEGLVARVSLDGALTLEEEDLRRGDLALARTRVDGDAREGLFGRGWRTWLDARPGDGLAGARFDAAGRPIAWGALRAAWSAGRVRVWAPDDAAVDLLLEGGRVARARGHLIDVRYAYTARGDLARVDVEGRRARAYEVVEGRVTSVAGATGRLLAVRRDARGRVARLEAPGGARRYTWWDAGAAAETDDGARWTWRRGEGVEHAWGPGERALARATPDGLALASPWGDFAVTRDAAGRAREVTGPFGRVVFTRDARGRRVGVARSNGVGTTLAYEADGAPAVTHIGPGGPLPPAPRRDDEPDPDDDLADGPDGGRVARGDAVAWWTVDAAGRLVAAGDLRLRHDAAGRVVEVEGPPGDAGPAWVVRYAWDAAGRLARAERRGASVEVVAYGWTDEGRPASRADEAGLVRVVEPWLVRATLGPGGRARIDVLDPDAPEAAPPLASRVDGAWLFLHDDGRGSVVAYTDAAGRLVARAAFGRRGEALADPGPPLPLFFAGREVDRAAGLVLVGGRPYAPGLGRFLAPDPTRRGARAYANDGLVGALERR
ncbi:MAG: hypothetical protein M9894_07990 [Planctomycetes bacterium]|nr:hypothetical protein [Planctomycetota bacterium]